MVAKKELDADKLKNITDKTIEHYNINAEDFWFGSKDHDVTQNYNSLLNAISSTAPFKILDFGCGPGRDLLYFKKIGHEVTGLDGSIEFVKMAKKISGVEVLHQDFLNLKLPDSHFDGIFANATLFHIPSQEFTRVLKDLNKCLKDNGILFCSIPRGNGEDFYDTRYGAYYEIDEMTKFLNDANFEIISHYYRPAGLPISQQPWLAIVSRKKQVKDLNG
ncbi:MAG: class I SAM-dependent methyltransferase [Candidatus Sericytochromatia bacterium]|nr:class I SAM-dependent methyltransferase [Candidatus Sericytochromatia bacterium]